MSAFRQLTVWSLRGLALWGCFEVAASAYAFSADKARQLEELSGQSAVMGRLTAQLQALQTDNQRKAAQIRRLRGPPAGAIQISSPEALSVQMRDQLIGLGAQAPAVEITAAATAPGVQSLNIETRWREDASNAPALLQSFAQLYPDASVSELELSRQADLVTVAAKLHWDEFGP